MLGNGIDAKTAAEKGGWDDIALFMKTYAHAMTDPTLTDVVSDTPVTRGESSPQQKQKVSKNERPVRGDNRTGQSHMGAWGGWALAPDMTVGEGFPLPPQLVD
jgi:uncharacterized protein YcfJ